MRMSNENQEMEIVEGLNITQLAKLRKNNHKPIWTTMSDLRGLHFLKLEVEELEEALESKDPKWIMNECADVANFCAMLHANAKMVLFAETVERKGNRLS